MFEPVFTIYLIALLKSENFKPMNQDKPQKRWEKLVIWVKKLGVLGFLFFLIKGLLWLIIPALLAYFATR
jgi:hypothetical protein